MELFDKDDPRWRQDSIQITLAELLKLVHAKGGNGLSTIQIESDGEPLYFELYV